MDYQAEVIHAAIPSLGANPARKFLGFQDAGKEEVDISQAELLVSVGRGIGEEENIAEARELADLMGGVLACSRPIVDKKWLPKYHSLRLLFQLRRNIIRINCQIKEAFGFMVFCKR